jgi:diphthamide synthase (EF-2-diphthine--ammonia ligase)
VQERFAAIVTCVDTTWLDREFAGRQFDAAFLRDLPAHVDPCGERGEFHTFVYDGPIFHHRVPVHVGERVQRGVRVFCDLTPAPALSRKEEWT